MMALIIILAALIIIALLRFGVSAEYGADGVSVKAIAGPFLIKLYPREEKPDKALKKAIKKEKKKAKEKPAKEKPAREKPGGLEPLLAILRAVKTALGRVRRKLLIKTLTIRYVAAGDDAFKTALSFGAANAAFGAVLPLLENNFKIRRRDFTALADFISTEQSIYAKAALSLAVWEAVYIALAMLPLLIGGSKKKTTDGKDVRKNGKTTDQ